MEIRKGYKQTEIGIIPEDWEVKELENIAGIKMGQSPNSFNYNTKGIGLPLIQGKADILGRKTVTSTFTTEITRTCKAGDLIMTVRAPVGYISKALFDACIGRGVCSIRYKNDFLYYYLILQESNWESLSKGSTYDSINSYDVKVLKVPLPPLPEQTAIANALTDIDALIESLEKLITKKRNIKQGAMQQLLTGKKRLPGFGGDGIKKQIDDIGYTYSGLSGKSKYDFLNGKYPYIPFLNILNHTIIDKNIFDYVQININEKQNKVLKGDLLFNGSSETPEEVGMCSVLLDFIPNLYLNSFCFGFRLNNLNQSNALFFSYYFRSNEGRKLLFSMAQGSTRYNLSKKSFLKVKLSLPSFEEQTAIAEVLSDMDSEIEALGKKLDKYKKVKQGMMQELLTGKKRLI